MYFTETPYQLTIITNLDLTAATSLRLLYTTSNRESGEWAPTASGLNALYQIKATDVMKRAVYKFQLIAVIGGVTKRSNYMQLTFESHL